MVSAHGCVRGGGRGFALADAVLFAQVFDIGVDHGFHVAAGVRVGAIASDGCGPAVGRQDGSDRDVARAPAKAAIGLAPEGEVEA
jgi:hypothetical protein